MLFPHSLREMINNGARPMGWRGAIQKARYLPFEEMRQSDQGEVLLLPSVQLYFGAPIGHAEGVMVKFWAVQEREAVLVWVADKATGILRDIGARRFPENTTTFWLAKTH